MMKALLYIVILLILANLSLAEVCLNQIQTVGTHNSFHLRTSEAIINLLASQLVQPVFESNGINLPTAWTNNMPTLTEQLNAGVRQIELDLYSDPQGGQYRYSAGLKFLQQDPELPHPELLEPGYKVFHLPDLDYNSTCYSFDKCLEEVKAWSVDNPQHIPIFIFLNPKIENEVDGFLSGDLRVLVESRLTATNTPPTSLTTVIPFNSSDFEQVEEVIMTVFDEVDIVKPDDVRGEATTLADAVLNQEQCGWPSLNETLGKIFFVLIAEDSLGPQYVNLYPGLEGALMFVMGKGGKPDLPEYVITEIAVDQLDPTTSTIPPNATQIVDELAAEVQAAVDSGFLVRSRADYDLIEAQSAFTYRKKALFDAGAHFVMTSVGPPSAWPNGYKVTLPDGSTELGARCNPVTGNMEESTVSAETINAEDAHNICTRQWKY